MRQHLELNVNAQDLIEPIKDPITDRRFALEGGLRQCSRNSPLLQWLVRRSNLVRENRFDVFRAEFRQAFVDSRGASQNVAGLEVVFTTVKGTDQSAGFADDQRAGGQIPGLQSGFPEAVKSSAGDVAKSSAAAPGRLTPDVFFTTLPSIDR